jgi:hypothetical protein
MFMIGRAIRQPLTTNASLHPRILRWFSSTENGGDSTDTSLSVEWRKEQLDRLERKFTDQQPPQAIEDDGGLQPAWKAMESRVTKRKLMTTEQRRGKTGRSNIRRTEEDVWLESGLYDVNENNRTK